ncbi:MAG: hypothetical protein WC635_03315 [Bacteriovorax sp.]|jgi:ankyrin repeat protein
MKRIVCALSLITAFSASADFRDVAPIIGMELDKIAIKNACRFYVKGSDQQKFLKAIECGNINKVSSLIAKADVNDSSNGFSPLVKALQLKNDYYSPVGPENYETIAKMLIANGADVNNVSKHGFTPLISALMKQSNEIATTIIPRLTSENINQIAKLATGDERVALNLTKDSQVIKMLLDGGATADTTLRTSIALNRRVKESILLTTLRQRSFEKASLLIDAGAEVNARTLEISDSISEGLTKTTSTHALFNNEWTYGQEAEFEIAHNNDGLIVFNKQIAEIEKLIEKGLDINSQDSNGATVLHYIAEGNYKYGDYEKDLTAKLNFLLSQKGLDKSIKNKDGKTALDLAIINLNLASELDDRMPIKLTRIQYFNSVIEKLNQ